MEILEQNLPFTCRGDFFVTKCISEVKKKFREYFFGKNSTFGQQMERRRIRGKIFRERKYLVSRENKKGNRNSLIRKTVDSGGFVELRHKRQNQENI